MPIVVQPREFNLRKTIIAGSVVLVAIAATYLVPRPGPKNIYWQGETMGTTFSIHVADSPFNQRKVEKLPLSIQSFFADFNREMSTYLPDSEISAFNQLNDSTPMQVSSNFLSASGRAIFLSRQLEGAFDPTVFPLVRRWGFGPAAEEAPPTPDEISELKKHIGVQHLEILPGQKIRKKKPGVQLDLNAVAKGRAADQVRALLNGAGAENVFVEVGGEISCSGVNKDGGLWRIGIDTPKDGAAPGDQFTTIIAVSDHGVATSGDYRNFKVDENGQRTTHIIDPRSGFPVSHQLASVTVVAPSCEEADAIATGLFVMGPEEGMKWVQSKNGVEALFIVRKPEGDFGTLQSPGFQAFVAEM